VEEKSRGQKEGELKRNINNFVQFPPEIVFMTVVKKAFGNKKQQKLI